VIDFYSTIISKLANNSRRVVNLLNLVVRGPQLTKLLFSWLLYEEWMYYSF